MCFSVDSSNNDGNSGCANAPRPFVGLRAHEGGLGRQILAAAAKRTEWRGPTQKFRAVSAGPGGMEGPLSVWASCISGWHLCWVVLDDRNGMLYRFKSHQQRRQRLGLLAKFGGISLLGAIVTKDPRESNGFSIVSEGREYRFQAPSEEERDTWVMELEEAVLRQMVSRRAYHAFLTTARAAMALLENLKEMILPGLLAQLDTMQPRKKAATMLSLLRTQAADTSGRRSPSTSERTGTRSLPTLRSPCSGSGQQLPNADNSTLMSDSDSAAGSTARYVTAHSSVDPTAYHARKAARAATAALRRCRQAGHARGSTSLFAQLPVMLESPGRIWEEPDGPTARNLADLCSSLPFGESLLNLDYPMSLLQSRSCLQALADLFACPELFAEIGSSTRASERMLRALRWYLAGMYYVKRGDDVTKPLEPVLGETHRCSWHLRCGQSMGDLQYAAEQVSVSPPQTCLYAECSSNGIRALAQIKPEAFSVGSYVQVRLHGNLSVYIRQYSEEYVFELPPGCVRDLASKPWFEFCGVANVSCRQTGYYAKMKFISKAPTPDSQRHSIQVDVYNPILNRPFVRLHGRWIDNVMASWASGEAKEILHSRLLKQARREPTVITEDNPKCSTVSVVIAIEDMS
ncbi:hypothetical protein HPB52_017602 [Rhipicephalus sanguineus]|uniref:PH domain-containing protein n=1 Tax=Rhipicephalus sanguineus TaxID=34632 RepID=A0A9D4SUU5_RHISA|nr:hypothetical protein HPB52_017602 [Rhipicephalus sanguineus]